MNAMPDRAWPQGKPLVAAQLEKLLRYVASFRDVWMPRHDALVAWVVESGIEDFSYRGRFFGGRT